LLGSFWEVLVEELLNLVPDAFCHESLSLDVGVTDAAHIFLGKWALRDFHIEGPLVLIVKVPHRGFDVVALGKAHLGCADVDKQGSRFGGGQEEFFEGCVEHVGVGGDKGVRVGRKGVLVVVGADEEEYGLGDHAVLVFVAVGLGVISCAGVQGSHFGPRDAEGIMLDSFARDGHDPMLSVEHACQMCSPTLTTTLNMLHLQKASRICAAEYSEGRGDAITQKIKMIFILLLIGDQVSSCELDALEDAVLV
jgi:hypothetical protein